MRPTSKKESNLRSNFANPHQVWVNGDQARRIARKRWKRKTSKLLRKQAKALEDDTSGVPWCPACKSYHTAPRNKEHHAELMCFAKWKEKK